MRKSLQEIGVAVDTGKLTGHSYGPIYESYFNPLRDEPINLLELGIDRGCSLRLWLEYFTKAHIYGVDSGPPVPISDPRLHQYQCPVHEEQVGKLFRPEMFDVIIDDASHDPAQQLAAFQYLWPALKSGGQYWIEDIYSSRTLPQFSMLPGFKVWANFKDAANNFRDDDILVLLRKP